MAMDGEVKYGLLSKKTGRLLGFHTSSNADADCCVSTAYELDEYSNNVWLADTPMHAAYVAEFSTEWYNADYETPMHEFKREDLEVVKVVTQYEVVDAKAPTFEEYMARKYNNPKSKHYDPGHYNFVMKEAHTYATYSLYDLRILLDEGL